MDQAYSLGGRRSRHFRPAPGKVARCSRLEHSKLGIRPRIDPFARDVESTFVQFRPSVRHACGFEAPPFAILPRGSIAIPVERIRVGWHPSFVPGRSGTSPGL